MEVTHGASNEPQLCRSTAREGMEVVQDEVLGSSIAQGHGREWVAIRHARRRFESVEVTETLSSKVMLSVRGVEVDIRRKKEFITSYKKSSS